MDKLVQELRIKNTGQITTEQQVDNMDQLTQEQQVEPWISLQRSSRQNHGSAYTGAAGRTMDQLTQKQQVDNIEKQIETRKSLYRNKKDTQQIIQKQRIQIVKILAQTFTYYVCILHKIKIHIVCFTTIYSTKQFLEICIFSKWNKLPNCLLLHQTLHATFSMLSISTTRRNLFISQNKKNYQNVLKQKNMQKYFVTFLKRYPLTPFKKFSF